MTTETNPGTGGSPDIKVYAIQTPIGCWAVSAEVNGKPYSSSTCRKKGDAKAHVKADLKEKGYPMPAELIYL